MALVLLRSAKNQPFMEESRGCLETTVMRQLREVIFGGRRRLKIINFFMPHGRPGHSVYETCS